MPHSLSKMLCAKHANESCPAMESHCCPRAQDFSTASKPCRWPPVHRMPQDLAGLASPYITDSNAWQQRSTLSSIIIFRLSAGHSDLALGFLVVGSEWPFSGQSWRVECRQRHHANNRAAGPLVWLPALCGEVRTRLGWPMTWPTMTSRDTAKFESPRLAWQTFFTAT